MKELTIEEKAKRYDKTLEQLKGLIEVTREDKCDIAEEDIMDIFPELIESDDEKIRKELIEKVKETPACIGFDNKNAVLTWLEKQGEQEEPQVYETEDGEIITYSESEGYKVVKPKFHEGEWVVDNAGYIWKIKGILNQFYILEDVGGGESRPTTEWADDTFHLWTIQDAEDGDVLQLGKVTAIFKEHISNVSCKCYCSVYNGEFEIPNQNDDDNCYGCHDATPATKEQRDLLFAKMKEAGYKWDAESKELKEIEQEPTEWSEEDENNLYLTTKAVAREYSGELFLDPKIVNEQVGIGKKLINWLNSFENRVQPQQEWSKQDEDYMKSAIELIRHCIWKSYRGLYTEDVIEWLKSLKRRFAENKEEFKE